MVRICFLFLVAVSLGCGRSTEKYKKPVQVAYIDSVVNRLDSSFGQDKEEVRIGGPSVFREPFSVVKCFRFADSLPQKVVIRKLDSAYESFHFYFSNGNLIKATFYANVSNQVSRVGSQYYERGKLIYAESLRYIDRPERVLSCADSVFGICSRN